MSELVGEMRAYYARRAPVYDSSMGYDDPATVESLAAVAGALRRHLAGRRVLEIACGPAFWTRVASDVARSILATDCTTAVLEQAALKGLDAGTVSFTLADAYDLSGVHGSFDAAFAVDWLAHVPNSRSREFFDGLHSRLERGARVVFCDQTPGNRSFTGIYDDEGNHLQVRELPDGSRFRVIKHFRSDDELRALIAPGAAEILIERFPSCRRVVASYTLV